MKLSSYSKFLYLISGKNVFDLFSLSNSHFDVKEQFYHDEIKSKTPLNSFSLSFTFVLLVFDLVKCLHIVHVEIPDYVDVKDVVKLSCSYNMGKNTLNSVKWYKDNQEFFR